LRNGLLLGACSLLLWRREQFGAAANPTAETGITGVSHLTFMCSNKSICSNPCNSEAPITISQSRSGAVCKRIGVSTQSSPWPSVALGTRTVQASLFRPCPGPRADTGSARQLRRQPPPRRRGGYAVGDEALSGQVTAWVADPDRSRLLLTYGYRPTRPSSAATTARCTRWPGCPTGGWPPAGKTGEGWYRTRPTRGLPSRARPP